MNALRALMEDIIDYAGLFPPAQLSLEETVRNYARYLDGPHSWMLGRLVCPTTKFADLDAFKSEIIDPSASKRPWRISALGRSASLSSSLEDDLVEDALAMRQLADRFEARVVADTLEVRLPLPLVADQCVAPFEDAVGAACGAIRKVAVAEKSGVSLFFEVPFTALWMYNVERLARAAAHLRNITRGESAPAKIGLKIRTGGTDRDRVPPVDEVSWFMECCATRGVPFKATAGLHHPLRHRSKAAGVKIHGFFNVFFAALMRFHHDLAVGEVEKILADKSAKHFQFESGGIRWGDWTATINQIREGREKMAVSFGSCSVDEPIEDLEKLGFSLEESPVPDAATPIT